jgi:hypothetical protein
VSRLFDPRAIVGAERLLAPRIPDLKGVRLGVLDDMTWNTNRMTAAGQPDLGALVALPIPAMKS